MSAATTALESIRGAQQAQELVLELRRGHALPMALHESLQRLRCEADGARLRAFTREIQKALESTVGVGAGGAH